MSFKSGIPLLKSLDDGNDSDEEEFTVETVVTSGRRGLCHCSKKRFCFVGVLAFAILVVLGIVAGAVVTALVLSSSDHGGNSGVWTTNLPKPSPTTPLAPQPTSTPLSTNCFSIQECKAKTDLRSYEVFMLPNQLRVLLISDPNSNISAASMDVAVGSFSDPQQVQGLAHFCEHMLFLGTKKYPDEHEYSNYLQTHGGGDNAFTSTQETNYYFSIEADYLEHALDMFAWFFIDPLFTPSATGREMNAVNAEHEKNLQSDVWRLWQLLKHVSNPLHPFSQFSTGTVDTLNKSNISDYLNEYYDSYYSANQVSTTLCVSGMCVCMHVYMCTCVCVSVLLAQIHRLQHNLLTLYVSDLCDYTLGLSKRLRYKSDVKTSKTLNNYMRVN